KQFADRRALFEIHRAGDETPLPVGFAVIEARPQFARLGLANAFGFAGGEIKREEAAAKRQNSATAAAQDQRTDRLRQRPGLLRSVRLQAMNGRPIGVDPVETLLVDVPKRPLTELVAIGARDFDPEHRPSPRTRPCRRLSD